VEVKKVGWVFPISGIRGRKGPYKVLYGEALPHGPTVYPFVYHFHRKGTSFTYLSLKKGPLTNTFITDPYLPEKEVFL